MILHTHIINIFRYSLSKQLYYILFRCFLSIPFFIFLFFIFYIFCEDILCYYLVNNPNILSGKNTHPIIKIIVNNPHIVKVIKPMLDFVSFFFSIIFTPFYSIFSILILTKYFSILLHKSQY